MQVSTVAENISGVLWRLLLLLQRLFSQVANYSDHSFLPLKLFLLRSSDVVLLPEASCRERMSPRRNGDVVTSLQADRHFLFVQPQGTCVGVVISAR